MKYPAVVRSYPALPVAKFDAQMASELTQQYMQNPGGSTAAAMFVRDVRNQGYSVIPRQIESQEHLALVGFQQKLNAERNFSEPGQTSQNLYANNVMRNLTEHGMTLTATVEDALWHLIRPDMANDNLRWHYDFKRRTAAPMARLFGATHMAPEVLIGHVPIPQSIVDQCSGRSCAAIAKYIIGDDGQAAISDGLDKGRLYPQDNLEPGDIIVLNGIHRKSATVANADIVQQWGGYRLTLQSEFSMAPELPQQLALLSVSYQMPVAA